MEKRYNINDFERKDTFFLYHNRNNPFIFLTVKLDITNIFKYCKKNKNTYATMGYLICKTVNEIENFKYRYEDGDVVYYDKVNIGYTQKKKNDVGFYFTEFNNDYEEYLKEYKLQEEEFLKGINKENGGHDQIWVSCAPWFDFTGLITPFDKNITIPQFIWGKFFLEGEKTFTHLMIMVHHGFVDGQHIGDFVNKLEININKFNKERKE